MPSVDVSTAPDRFLTMSVDGYAPGHNRPGNCARWTYFALPTVPNTSPLPSAIAAWNNAPAAHRHAVIDGQTKIPRGMVIALGPVSGPRWAGDENYPYGDVFVATGDGVGYDSVGVATDSLAGTGIIGRITLRERMAQTGRPLLGFLSSYGGWTLTSSTSQASAESAAKPSTTDLEDDEAMRFTVEYTNPTKKTGRKVTVWIGADSIILTDFTISGTKFTVANQIALLRLWYKSTATSAVTLTQKQRQAVQKILRSMK